MSLGLALLALLIEAAIGYPDWLCTRIGHPVTWFGALIGALDGRLNHESDAFGTRRLKGLAALLILLAIALAAGVALTILGQALPFGSAVLALVASTLLAQRSLHAHVADVARGLDASLADGRAAVARIVGRDVSALDEAGVARAAIESLAENFSDGVAAPALWLACFGLPGALAYKAVNTADSMIGHKTERHLAFGFAAARCDDLMNFLPARVSAALIALAAAALPGGSPSRALAAVRRDARKHLSPNAGWPEAAMAGALGLKLGGQRAYGETPVDGATLGDGRSEAASGDILRALALYRRATALLWAVLAAGAISALV
jgi:adenosylcobinamide-phosphate synthase